MNYISINDYEEVILTPAKAIMCHYLIKRKIRHHEHSKCRKDHIQSTNIVLEVCFGNSMFSAVYCAPKHAIKQEQFIHYFKTLGVKFIAIKVEPKPRLANNFTNWNL